MTTEEWFEKATAYFNNAMSDEEMRRFETETAADEELSGLMQLWKYTEAEGSLYYAHEKDAAAFVATHKKLRELFVSDVQEVPYLSTENVLPSKPAKFIALKWFAVAAVVAGIAFMIMLLKPSQKENAVAETTIVADSGANVIKTDTAAVLVENDKSIKKEPLKKTTNDTDPAVLFAQAFVADDMPEDTNGPLDDAFFYYASKQYRNAVHAFDSAGSKAATRGNNVLSPLDIFYKNYYKGLSLMLLNKSKDAIPVLQQAASQSPAQAFKAKAQWYLALAYLRQEKISDAVAVLNQVVNNTGAGLYKNKAAKLLDALAAH